MKRKLTHFDRCRIMHCNRIADNQTLINGEWITLCENCTEEMYLKYEEKRKNPKPMVNFDSESLPPIDPEYLKILDSMSLSEYQFDSHHKCKYDRYGYSSGVSHFNDYTQQWD